MSGDVGEEQWLTVPGVQAEDLQERFARDSIRASVGGYPEGTEVRGRPEALERVCATLDAEGTPYDRGCRGREYAGRLLERLAAAGFTLVTAESCTAGLVAARLSDFPGSSRVLWGGFIVYANEAKIRLGLSPAVLETYGAVSRNTVCGLVQAALAASGTDIAVAVSGIAGPGGGTAEKPVGTVFVAAGSRDHEPAANEYRFSGTRAEIRSLSVGACFANVQKLL